MEFVNPTPVGHCCYIVPPHILKAIAHSDAASAESREVALKTLTQIRRVRETRVGIQSSFAAPHHHGPPHGQGIVPSYISQAIIDSDATSEESKERAQKHLAGVSAIAAAKVKHPTPTPGTGAPTPYRVLYDSQQTSREQKKKLWEEGNVPANPDPYAKQVYDHFGNTFKFYSDILKRNSIDGKGLHLIGNVHFDDDNGRTPGYDNAFWDGEQMAFGDGDPQIFNTFTESLDITGHELTHGVTSYTANLEYEYQAGALNESISDVFGTLVKQYTLNQKAKDADWLIGAGLFRNSTNARALRDMANPGTAYTNNRFIGSDPQPKDMDGYVNSSNDEDGDWGGVHTNSGIPNRAFYLAATGVGDYAWDPAGKIWYAALTDPALKGVDTKNAFKVFADLTITHAQAIGGDAAATAVKKAWTTVKVL